MECIIHPNIDYESLYKDIKYQKECILNAVKSLYSINIHSFN